MSEELDRRMFSLFLSFTKFCDNLMQLVNIATFPFIDVQIEEHLKIN